MGVVARQEGGRGPAGITHTGSLWTQLWEGPESCEWSEKGKPDPDSPALHTMRFRNRTGHLPSDLLLCPTYLG